MLARACETVGRDPATVWRSLGLYTLVGENETDLTRRFDRLRAATPPGVLDELTLDDWRVGRLVGTVEQVGEQAAEWAELGVETLIAGAGRAALPGRRASTTSTRSPRRSVAPDDRGGLRRAREGRGVT